MTVTRSCPLDQGSPPRRFPALEHPIDIERALKGDYSNDRKKRDLQLEVKAHIAVQQWIDSGSLKGRALTADAIRETHRRFCEACSSSKTRRPKRRLR
jgi:hypothetical protein